MKIKRKLPPFWFILHWFFPNANPKTICVAWGDTLYTYGELTPDLLEHEKVHLQRQRHSKVIGIFWIARYVLSRKFRLNEEVLAYKAQWNFTEKWVKDRNWRFKCLIHLIDELSSSLYGNLCTKDKAKPLITG